MAVCDGRGRGSQALNIDGVLAGTPVSSLHAEVLWLGAVFSGGVGQLESGAGAALVGVVGDRPWGPDGAGVGLAVAVEVAGSTGVTPLHEEAFLGRHCHRMLSQEVAHYCMGIGCVCLVKRYKV